MSSIKGCKRCRYNKIEYEIDYNKSAQEQKIYYKEMKICGKCNYINPKIKHKEAELDNYPSDMNVDLSKIIHEHNHNKFDREEESIMHYDKEGKCIKSTLMKYYKCDFCDKPSDYKYFYECEHTLNIIKYYVDYEWSVQEQKVCYRYSEKCSKCNHYDYHTAIVFAELDNYPKDIDVDLSKIIHEHNHNKIHYVEEKPTYDKQGNCIELVLINHYKCDFCDKLSDYTDIKNKYDLNNPCDRMNELTKWEKEHIRLSKAFENCVLQ